jgi:hypothetical protein
MPPFLWELAIWLHRIQIHAVSIPQGTSYRLFFLCVLGAVFFWTAVWLAFSRAALRLQLQINELEPAEARMSGS